MVWKKKDQHLLLQELEVALLISEITETVSWYWFFSTNIALGKPIQLPNILSMNSWNTMPEETACPFQKQARWELHPSAIKIYPPLEV